MWLSNDISLLIMASYIRLTYKLYASDVASASSDEDDIFRGCEWMRVKSLFMKMLRSEMLLVSHDLLHYPICAMRLFSTKAFDETTLKFWAASRNHPKLLKWRWQLFWFIHELALQFPLFPLRRLNWGFWFFCQSMLEICIALCVRREWSKRQRNYTKGLKAFNARSIFSLHNKFFLDFSNKSETQWK